MSRFISLSGVFRLGHISDACYISLNISLNPHFSHREMTNTTDTFPPYKKCSQTALRPFHFLFFFRRKFGQKNSDIQSKLERFFRCKKKDKDVNRSSQDLLPVPATKISLEGFSSTLAPIILKQDQFGATRTLLRPTRSIWGLKTSSEGQVSGISVGPHRSQRQDGSPHPEDSNRDKNGPMDPGLKLFGLWCEGLCGWFVSSPDMVDMGGGGLQNLVVGF